MPTSPNGERGPCGRDRQCRPFHEGCHWRRRRAVCQKGSPRRMPFRVLVVGGLAAMLLGGQPARATTEEVIVPAPMPPNCSRNSDGTITCDGMPLDAWCEQNALADHVVCGGTGGGGSGGGSGGGGSGGGSGGDQGDEEGEQESDLEKECAAEGGIWANGGCDFPPSEEETDEADDSDDLPDGNAEKRDCEEGGGTWRTTYCDQLMDLDLKAGCACFVYGVWFEHGKVTYPNCLAIERYERYHDPQAVCQWPYPSASQ